MRARVGEDGSDHASNVCRSDRICLASPERQFNAASVADALGGKRQKAFQKHRRPDGDDRQPRPREHLLAEPVLSLLRARGGVLDAHLGDGHLGHVDQGVHSKFPSDRRHGHRCLQVPGGHGHAEENPPTAANDPIDVGRVEQVSDDDLGASGPQGRRPVVLAADHGANRKPAMEEQAGHGSPDCPELTGCPRYKDPLSAMRLPSLSLNDIVFIFLFGLFEVFCW